MRLLILTNLFPTRWDPLRGAFNRQQFERLGAEHDVSVITAVPLPERLRPPVAQASPAVVGLATDEFVFVYPPRVGRSLHALFWRICLWLQKGRRLRRERYDCLLVSWAYPDAAAAGAWARRRGLPYVVKVHGSDLNVQAEDPARRRQIRKALLGAKAVVAVSRALADKAIAIGADPQRVHVIYNGVDGGRFSPGPQCEARARLKLPPIPGPLWLFVGNLKDTKGCMDLLEAFAAARVRQPKAHLVFVGAGPCGSALQARAQALGCATSVQLVGAVAHGELADWFRAADVFCLPSHNEGVPNVVLESMACGVPVVATRVGGIPEVVPEHAGILVTPQDIPGIADALVQASQRPWDTARIASHARGFCWQANIAQLCAVLENAVNSSTPAGNLPS
ncbi:glycosyltransferase family 4 protein [Dyella sp.]|jgi:glycosyltransferase involved in cell wall biosynthesis|uniref:glycosyltransferase family 4 protein n=1 Tax=Dyella sp. TaxID=1869338 RepID=UPI002D77202F|nr:glycosyltransferase family 4 protein [Dyella sp.]HET6432961.1 glycosyltransferase family 4 protein [Dyella sp.]